MAGINIDNMILSTDKLNDKITDLSGYMDTLMGLIESYRKKRSDIENFTSDGDTNYDKMCENVDANINAAKRAYTIASNARDAFQSALDEVTAASDQTRRAMGTATDTANAKIATMLPVNELLGD